MSGRGGVFISVPFGPEIDWRTGATPAEYSPREGDRFIEAVGREAGLRAPSVDGSLLASVYLGGCGPTGISLDQLYRLLQALYDTITMVPEEQAIVVLPGTVDPARAKVLRESGFDRAELRTANPESTRADFDVLREAGFATVGIELAAAGEPERWEATLSALGAAGPDHVVLHGAAAQLDRGRVRLEHDYREYLPGHFSRPGHECRFLEAARAGAPVLGLGPGAFTRLGGRIVQSEPDPGRYAGTLKKNRLPLVAATIEASRVYVEPYR